jgi:deoxycytidylate deaminase
VPPPESRHRRHQHRLPQGARRRENAVINCDSPRSTEKFVFVTHLPCTMCGKRLINLGNVRRVYYGLDYRSRGSLDLFASVGIEVVQLPFLD